VQPEKPRGIAKNGRESRNREARGIGGDDRVGSNGCLDATKRVDLDPAILWQTFDHQRATAEIISGDAGRGNTRQNASACRPI
jgi:hypothetical protein